MLIAIFRTVILYAFIILAIRLMGKRQISDMQPSELVVTLVVSDIASLPMQNTSQPLLSGVVPVLVLVALELTTSTVMVKSHLFRRMVCGSPVVIIENGRLLQKKLQRLRMTAEDLLAQLRQQDVFAIEDVQYCIMETNGSLSVLEKPDKPQAAVISDGRLDKNALQLCRHSAEDVEKILKKNHTKIEDVFLMTLNSSGDCRIFKKEH